MINKIKFIIKSKKNNLKFLIRDTFEDENIRKLRGKQELKAYLKKCICHPISFLKLFFNKKFNINYIEIVLTTKCTLNCKGCSALMNYYSERDDINIDNNIKAIKRILDSCDLIHHLRLLGGEPFLYPNLYEILDFIKNQEKIRRTTIVTNGTLTINDKRILRILKNYNFDVFISNYGKNSKRKNELIKQLEDNNISYILGNEESLWRDYGDLECRNRSEKELRRQFLGCAIMCTSLFNGKLHHCPRSTHGTNLKKIPLRKQDYIDLLDENITDKQLRKELYNFFYRYVPYVEACNYCNSATKDLKSMPAGQQCKK